MLAMNIPDVPIVLPHSNTYLIRIVQKGEIQHGNDGTKELCVGKEEKRCQNCNWIGAENSCKPLEEYSLPTIIRPTKLHTYRGKTNCSHVLTYASNPSKKQVSIPKSRLIKPGYEHCQNVGFIGWEED